MATLVVGQQPNPYQVLQASLQPAADAISTYARRRAANADQVAAEQRQLAMQKALMGERFNQARQLTDLEQQNRMSLEAANAANQQAYLTTQDQLVTARQLEQEARALQAKTGMEWPDGMDAKSYIQMVNVKYPEAQDAAAADNIREIKAARSAAFTKLEDKLAEISQETRDAAGAAALDRIRARAKDQELAANATTLAELLPLIPKDERQLATDDYEAAFVEAAAAVDPSVRPVVAAYTDEIKGYNDMVKDIASKMKRIPAGVLTEAEATAVAAEAEDLASLDAEPPAAAEPGAPTPAAAPGPAGVADTYSNRGALGVLEDSLRSLGYTGSAVIPGSPANREVSSWLDRNARVLADALRIAAVGDDPSASASHTPLTLVPRDFAPPPSAIDQFMGVPVAAQPPPVADYAASLQPVPQRMLVPPAPALTNFMEAPQLGVPPLGSLAMLAPPAPALTSIMGVPRLGVPPPGPLTVGPVQQFNTNAIPAIPPRFIRRPNPPALTSFY